MEIPYILLGSGSVTLLIGIASLVYSTGRFSHRVEELEKKSHESPCKIVEEIRVLLAEIKKDIEWLKKNGARKE